jgi:hypothetical protein
MVVLAEATLALGHEAGMGDQEIYNLGDQFRSVYPDNWETLLTERLMQRKNESGDRARLQEKRDLIRTMEMQLYTMNRANEEKDLDKRIAELQKRIGKEDSDG